MCHNSGADCDEMTPCPRPGLIPELIEPNDTAIDRLLTRFLHLNIFLPAREGAAAAAVTLNRSIT